MFQNILQGVIPIDDPLNEVGRYMLVSFNLTENMKETDKIYIGITKEDFKSYWENVKLKTALTIPQLHFGHYK